MLCPVVTLATSANAARPTHSGVRVAVLEELLVVHLEVRRHRLVMPGGELRRAEVLRGRAHLQVDGLLELAIVVVRRTRGRTVAGAACQPLRPALGLALLGALSLLGHRAA